MSSHVPRVILMSKKYRVLIACSNLIYHPHTFSTN